MNSDLTTLTIIVGILHSGIRLATPYLYAAIGEMFSQRSGVLNLGVDGIMLMGAFFGFFTVFKTESLLLGVLAAALVGGLMGLILCVVSITYQAEQGISGIGLFMFGLGASSLLFKTMLGTVEGIKGFSELEFCAGSFCLADIPVVGEIFFNHSLMTYGAFALVPLAWWVLNKTTWGLKIRSVGQNPEAADSLGVNVIQSAVCGRYLWWRFGRHCWCVTFHLAARYLSGKLDQRHGFYCRCSGLLWQLATRRRFGRGSPI